MFRHVTSRLRRSPGEIIVPLGRGGTSWAENGPTKGRIIESTQNWDRSSVSVYEYNVINIKPSSSCCSCCHQYNKKLLLVSLVVHFSIDLKLRLLTQWTFVDAVGGSCG